MNSAAVASATLILECVDGRDDHFKMEIGAGARLVLSGTEGEGQTAIRELENLGGNLIFQYQNGQLHLDASDCAVPVKLNGNLVTAATLRSTDVLRIGNSIWKAFPAQAHAHDSVTATAGALKQRFNNFIGLEELKDFRLQDIFSQVFKKHSLAQMEDQLVTGTLNNTPAITDIETGWAKPWLFSRMLLVTAVLSCVLIMGFRMFSNENLLPGIIFVGSFAVPVSVLIFFLEMNAPRNASIFMVMSLLFLGGVASLIVTLLFFERLDFLSFLGASAAGIIEETAKLLCVVLIMGKFTRYKWVLNGLLFGAAIGTGFAAFESAGYAFRIMLGAGVDSGVDNIVLRGVLAPFGHIIWTGNAAAALWLVKGEQAFRWSMLKDGRFLRVFASSMVLHMLWNAPFLLFPLPLILDLKFAILGVLGWIITFRLVQQGLNQLNDARHQEIERLRAS